MFAQESLVPLTGAKDRLPKKTDKKCTMELAIEFAPRPAMPARVEAVGPGHGMDLTDPAVVLRLSVGQPIYYP
eukprot:16284070-Heterocapsa_arctica.AAC.1